MRRQAQETNGVAEVFRLTTIVLPTPTSLRQEQGAMESLYHSLQHDYLSWRNLRLKLTPLIREGARSVEVRL